MEAQKTLHRRKSSKDAGDENTIVLPSPPANQNDFGNGEVASVAFPSTQLLAPPPSSRNRVQSTPVGHARSLSTASALPTNRHPPGLLAYGGRTPLPNGSNMYGAVPLSPTSPFRPSFQPSPPPRGHGHARTRSVSAFAPASPSPLASSFPVSASAHDPLSSTMTSATTATSNPAASLHVFPSSNSAPDNSSSASPPSPTSPISGRRHTRLHSRNLSFFFPRPGALSAATIAEDGTQELELGLQDEDAPVSDIPAAGSSVDWQSSSNNNNNNNRRNLLVHQPPSPLGVGFTFGGRPSSSSANGNGGLPVPPMMTPSSSTSSVSSRRGHHHKHSLSHNFFSFLEPGGNGTIDSSKEGLHTQPTPMPVSPWTNTTQSLQADAASSTTTSTSPSPSPSEISHNHFGDEHNQRFAPSFVGLCQFALGSWLWVVGQQVGSLACTGLGYWVVFDAVGVAIGKVIPQWLKRKVRELERIRRPYGNARLEAVLMFAHSVYLMFSAVYVCKETVEHILLSLGQHTSGGEKHHHHFHSSEENGVSGIDFPITLVFISLISLIGTALVYDNHVKLVNVTNTRIPSLRTLIRSLLSPAKRTYHGPPPTSQLAIMLSNPYTASPLFFCLVILFIGLLIPPSQHEACDMILAAVIAIVTFNTAYSACTVLGTILLQTAPPRGLPSAKMEAFLRVMRELERHPQVLHLPAPHIWQLAPSTSATAPDGTSFQEKRNRDSVKLDPLVVTIELHVKSDLSDEDVLNLTRWAWERCLLALGGEVKRGQDRKGLVGRGDGPEVTVGVVRG
ncbi:hypothetical protein JOM56_004513 [Amanita muscaria]